MMFVLRDRESNKELFTSDDRINCLRIASEYIQENPSCTLILDVKCDDRVWMCPSGNVRTDKHKDLNAYLESKREYLINLDRAVAKLASKLNII